MRSPPDKLRRPDLQRSVKRDLRRYRNREEGHRSFWRSMSVLGAVGWPIVLTMVLGAWVGRWLDRQWDTGVRLTLMLVFAGALIGGSVAWSIIQRTRE